MQLELNSLVPFLPVHPIVHQILYEDMPIFQR